MFSNSWVFILLTNFSFSKRNPIFSVNYIVDNFVENVDVSNSKFV